MYWFERSICDALDEMRRMDKVRNYASMAGLIEEVQSMANRMEAHLEGQKHYTELCTEIKKLEKKKKELLDDNSSV